MQHFLLHTFLVAITEKSPYCFLYIFSMYPDGSGTGGTGIFPSFSQGSSNLAFFYYFFPCLLPKPHEYSSQACMQYLISNMQHMVCSFVLTFLERKVPHIYNSQTRHQEAGCDFNRWCNIWSRPEMNLPELGLIRIH